MSDRATLFGLAFGAVILIGAALGLCAYEAGRGNGDSLSMKEPQVTSSAAREIKERDEC